jgi:esterase/lipase superfamily enzyme
MLATTTARPDARLVKVLVATTRERAEPGGNVFTTDRAHALNFAEFTVAVPPGRRDGGRVELAGGAPNSQPGFAVVGQAALTKATFRERVTARQRRGEKQNVGVFVHGFNNNFQEALFRFAQIAADADVPGTPILFSWPSEARATAYLADRDSVTYSRDFLAELLTGLAADPKIGRITLLAHSMGAWLTVETLRQLRFAGKHSVINRLRVVLAAPDIDVDVFRQQVAVIGPLSPPMDLLVSRDDRALSLSSRLAGGNARVGALDVNDPRVQDAVLRARIRIVDISELSSPDRFNHDRFVQLAAMYPRLSSPGADGSASGLGTAGAFILDAVGANGGSPLVPTASRPVAGN